MDSTNAITSDASNDEQHTINAETGDAAKGGKRTASIDTMSAASRVFGIAELLHLIVGKLTVQDLISTCGVNAQFYSGVAKSLEAQKTVARRPKSSLPEKWLATQYIHAFGSGRASLGTLFYELERNTYHLRDHGIPQPSYFYPVEICSLVAVVGNHRSRRARFTMQPTDFALWEVMPLAYPPQSTVLVDLTYVLDSDPSISMHLSSGRISQESALTVGDLIHAAYRRCEGVWISALVVDLLGTVRKSSQFRQSSSLGIEGSRLVKVHGGRFNIDLNKSWIEFDGVQIFTPDAWAAMERDGKASVREQRAPPPPDTPTQRVSFWKHVESRS